VGEASSIKKGSGTELEGFVGPSNGTAAVKERLFSEPAELVLGFFITMSSLFIVGQSFVSGKKTAALLSIFCSRSVMFI
jgi:hypothetical protein